MMSKMLRSGKGLFSRKNSHHEKPANTRQRLLAAIEQVEPRVLLAGDGLTATYFNNADFTGQYGTRIERSVDHNWSTGAPLAGMGADTFSARWTGLVEAQKNETYTFYTQSDDGVRLYVNGQKIIDNWTVHSVTENRGTIALQAGQRYDIKLEYYENAGGAVARLLWSSPTTAKAVIPQSQLYSSAAATVPTSPSSQTPFTPTMLAAPGTIQAEYFDNGGSGVAFFDVDAANLGGVYRSTGVDIQGAADYGSGYNIGWTKAGEWLEYTVNVATSGSYKLDLRLATAATGGSMHVDVDGMNKTGVIGVPNTGGWQKWQTLSKSGIQLAAGQHVFRVAFDTNTSAGYAPNFNWFALTKETTATPTPTPTPIPSTQANASNTFVIGVWAQPVNSFDKWKARGINTLLGYEGQSGTVSMDAWDQAAVNKGLLMIRQPSANPYDDRTQANLIGWLQPDEPDYQKIAPSVLQAQYARWKSIDPTKQVLVNLVGGMLLNRWADQTLYQEYMKAADLISHDLYPVARHNNPNWLHGPGDAVTRLSQWSGGKPQYAFIEASDQQLPYLMEAPGVTPAQFRGQLWNSIIAGAKGIFYFPQQISGFKYDAVPQAVVDEMTKQNARITALGKVLLSTANPAGVGATVASPLRVAWRQYGGKTYFIVLNMSYNTVSNQKIALQGIGATNANVHSENRSVAISANTITDNFAPFETHVYEVG